MKEDIYIAIIEMGFTAKPQDREENKRLEIERSFTDELERRIEVYKEGKYSFYVIMYGSGFMNGERPTKRSITSDLDIENLKDYIETVKY